MPALQGLVNFQKFRDFLLPHLFSDPGGEPVFLCPAPPPAPHPPLRFPVSSLQRGKTG